MGNCSESVVMSCDLHVTPAPDECGGPGAVECTDNFRAESVGEVPDSWGVPREGVLHQRHQGGVQVGGVREEGPVQWDTHMTACVCAQAGTSV